MSYAPQRYHEGTRAAVCAAFAARHQVERARENLQAAREVLERARQMKSPWPHRCEPMTDVDGV